MKNDLIKIQIEKTKTLLFILVLFLSTNSCQNKLIERKQIEVKISPNIEVLGCLYNLTEQGKNSGYIEMPHIRKAANEHFKEFNQHPAVLKTQDFCTQGFWLHRLVEVMVNCTDFPDSKLAYKLPQYMYKEASQNKVNEDGKQQLLEYIELINQFYEESNFDSFLENNHSYYEEAKNQVLKNLPDKDFVSTMEEYYGRKNKGYIIIPSLLIPELMGFGAKNNTEMGDVLYNICGLMVRSEVMDSLNNELREMKQTDYTFDISSEIRELSVHEFGHNFVDYHAEKYRDTIMKYSYLFEPVKNRMTEIGYDNWWTCVDEHIVRTGEVRVALKMANQGGAERLEKGYIERFSFIYLPQLSKKMEDYENNRDKYISFGDFFPELLTVFDKIDTVRIQ